MKVTMTKEQFEWMQSTFGETIITHLVYDDPVTLKGLLKENNYNALIKHVDSVLYEAAQMTQDLERENHFHNHEINEIILKKVLAPIDQTSEDYLNARELTMMKNLNDYLDEEHFMEDFND